MRQLAGRKPDERWKLQKKRNVNGKLLSGVTLPLPKSADLRGAYFLLSFFESGLQSGVQPRYFRERGPIALTQTMGLGGDNFVTHDAGKRQWNLEFGCRFRNEPKVFRAHAVESRSQDLEFTGSDFVYVFRHCRVLQQFLDHGAERFRVEALFFRKSERFPHRFEQAGGEEVHYELETRGQFRPIAKNQKLSRIGL